MLSVVRSCAAFAALAAMFCVPAVAAPHRQKVTEPGYTQDQTAQVQSASGRITSVQGNTFTLETRQSRGSAAQNSEQDGPKVMTFTIDQNTTVEGKIEVDAAADVTYRVQSGNNIAVSVRIVPPQS